MASNSRPHHSGNSSLKFRPKEGKTTMMIQAKDLSIVWGNDNRYWSVPKKEWSAAELRQVSWLEVTGVVEVEEPSPNKKWEVGLRVSLNPDAFGWGKYPIYMMIKKQGKISWTKITINPNHKGEFDIRGRWIKPDRANDFNDPNLYFGLYEVWSGKWKGGLNIHFAYIKELP